MRMMKCESMPSRLKIKMTWIWITFAVLCPNIFRIASIQTRIHRPIRFIDERTFTTRHFRHLDSSVHLDWERGLRESTVQALFREHFGDVNLKTHIYSAPILGKQDKATPFGDIAILARGQLYANYAGFIFVQDPYQNDCDDCHNIDAADNTKDRCIINHCQTWHPKNNEKIMALWKIRRIRHRSRQDSPKYEVEFTISPVGLRYRSERYLTKEGTFNYNLPGHVFVLKSSESRQHGEEEQVVDHFKQGAFIAQTVDGRKYTLHGFHGLTPQSPRYYELPPRYPEFTSTSSTTQYADEEDEKNAYQALLNELHKKTSPESTRFTPNSKTSTTLSDETLMQFIDGQMVPITELETPFITKTTPGYVTVRFPASNVIPATSVEHKTSPTKVTAPTFSNKVKPQSYGLMRPKTTPLAHRTMIASNVVTTQPLPTRPHTNVAQSHTTINKKLSQTPGMMYTKPIPFYTTASTENNISHTFGTSKSMMQSATKAPVKMTFHFFAAEEAQKPTLETFKVPLTTTLHYTSTEYETLPYTLVPTKPTIMVFSEAPFTKAETTTVVKKPNSYSTIDSTKKTFTTKIPSTNNYRPATVVKVSKPTVDDTTIYSSTTQPITKSISSIALESSSSYSKVPITVLEESSTKTTLEHKGKSSTTQFTQPQTVSRTPKTTYRLQVYNPTTAMSQLTNIGQEMNSEESATLDSTTYSKIPTLTAEKEPIQTTLGMTTIMGTSQNNTTEMVYYAAEETENPTVESTQIAPTTFVQSTRSFIGITEPTYSILETKTTSPTTVTTPKRVLTTIGTISVKTSPISADEELFGITKSFAKKHKLTKRPKNSTTSEPNDFLVGGGSSPDYAVPLFKKPSKDYSADDIFGPTKDTTKKTSKIASAIKHYTKSDLEQALFDTNNRKSKALIRRRYRTTEVPLNVNYSNFFEASTSPTTTQARDPTIATGMLNASVTKGTTTVASRETGKDLSVANKRKANGVTTERIPIATTMLNYETLPHDDRKHSKPVTSQSYLTSISYEVNKRPRLSDGKSKELIPRIRKYSKIEKDDVDRTHVAKETRHSTKVSKMPDKITSNDFALRLVGHAKAVEYLDQAALTGASGLEIINAKTTTKSKYTRRRNYTPKAKRPTRKKVVKSKELADI